MDFTTFIEYIENKTFFIGRRLRYSSLFLAKKGVYLTGMKIILAASSATLHIDRPDPGAQFPQDQNARNRPFSQNSFPTPDPKLPDPGFLSIY
jgi:hypothetical protein